MISKTSIKYNRASGLYDLVETPVEQFFFRRYRKKALAHAIGKILEVGVGTGKNFPYYSHDIEVVGIDFSSGMLEKAGRRKEKLDMNNVTLLEMDAQDLSFADNSFDTVISTFVFCTVPDPGLGLRQLLRVLKPGGRAIFLEHMRSANWFLNIHLYLMNLVTKPMMGTSMIRETQKNIEKAGFEIESVENLIFDVVRLIVASNR